MISAKRLKTASLPLPPYDERLPTYERLQRVVSLCVVEEPDDRPTVTELVAFIEKIESEDD
jgi:hypothetical protein